MDWRFEAPWLLLLAGALLAPLLVIDQGGDWHSALTAGLACLVAPAAGVQIVLLLGQLISRCAPAEPPHIAGPGRQR